MLWACGSVTLVVYALYAVEHGTLVKQLRPDWKYYDFESPDDYQLISGDPVSFFALNSGIIHLGVLCNIPTISLFGSGIADKWAPKGAKHITINKKVVYFL